MDAATAAGGGRRQSKRACGRAGIFTAWKHLGCVQHARLSKAARKSANGVRASKSAPEKRAQTPFFPDAFPLPTFIEGVADADDLPDRLVEAETRPSTLLCEPSRNRAKVAAPAGSMTHTAQAAISAPEAERKGGNKRAQTSAELAALELPQHGQTAKALRGNGGPPLRCVICTGVKFAARAPKGDEQPLCIIRILALVQGKT